MSSCQNTIYTDPDMKLLNNNNSDMLLSQANRGRSYSDLLKNLGDLCELQKDSRTRKRSNSQLLSVSSINLANKQSFGADLE